MIIYCIKCDHPIRTGEEVTFIAKAYYKELGSKVTYSVSAPHEVVKESIAHVKCPTRQD